MNTIIKNRDTVIIESGLNQSVSIVQPLKQYVDVVGVIVAAAFVVTLAVSDTLELPAVPLET